MDTIVLNAMRMEMEELLTYVKKIKQIVDRDEAAPETENKEANQAWKEFL